MVPLRFLDETNSDLRDQYQRIALVSHRRHIKSLEPIREDTLIVTSDWLMWQECLDDNMHCIHHEWGLLRVKDTYAFQDELNLRAADWIYVGNEDISNFQGVSLGRQFVGAVAGFIATYYRLTNSLLKIVEKFQPREVLFFDLWHDRFFLDYECRRFIVDQVAEERHLKVIDKFDPIDPADPDLPASYVPDTISQPDSRGLKSIFRYCVYSVLSQVSRLLLLVPSRKRKVVCLVSWNMMRGMLAAKSGLPVRAMVLVDAIPKSPIPLMNVLKKGVFPFKRPESRLSEKEAGQIDNMISAYNKHWDQPASNQEEAVRLFVRKSVLTKSRFQEMAIQVKSISRLLDIYRPDSVLLDGLKNPPHSIIGELAYINKIPVEYTWHAPHAPERVKFDGLGSDPRKSGFVTRCLTWGPAHEMWLEKTGAKVATTMVGNPLAGKYFKPGESNQKPVSSPIRSVVVLQYPSIHNDLLSPTSRQYEMYVYLVRLLTELGTENIIYKLHPSFWRISYFKKIADRFALECSIYKHEKLETVLNAVDLAIGPVYSGALLETLLAGKKHLSLSIDPTTIDRDYYQGLNLITRINDIRVAMIERQFIDNQEMLSKFCAVGIVDHPIDELWDALANPQETHA